MNEALVKLIVVYQRYISPYISPRCRFYPTCSEYMKQALINFGVFKGLFLTINRLCRCNPFFEGGADSVPMQNKKGNK